MKAERLDCGDHYVLQAFFDDGRPMQNASGEPIVADSRRCRNPETWLWGLVCKAGHGSISYSGGGRV